MLVVRLIGRAPDQCDQKCLRYARTASGRPSISSVDSARLWKAWYQNSRWACGARIRSPMPGSGGAMTRARTSSGRSLATVWAILLPMS